MAERRAADMPLREVFTEAERLARELVDHLENGFLPKASGLRDLVSVSDQGVGADDVHDVTVRNHAAQLLDRARFANELYKRFDECVETIGQKVSRITSGQ
ncbi:MAG: hypothetical protein CMJ65_03010 [Planctomycetaceae bacterium]|jgi:hypothetical protein|nr:hypothetical protein [Planctomycetaceae bacterium]MDP7277984.1 hypothetical protein [Planctomycetaceae bacterium]